MATNSPLRGYRILLVCAALCLLSAGCADNPAAPPTEPPGDTTQVPVDTTTAPVDSATSLESHGKVAPNFSIVFPQDRVNRIDIVIGAANWTAIQANMVALWGVPFGAKIGISEFPELDPDYVDATVAFNGKSWHHAGFRLKGNSSLGYAWRQGIYKLPFRLAFDEFEDSFPATLDQRFYGFKELSMSAGYQDNSLLHEKLASDLMRSGGVPAAHTAFYRVYVDFGQGLKYCGLYTMVEVIDDTMIKDQFGTNKGNIYKPESAFRTFAAAEFEKKNNKSAADWTDVQAVITAVNSGLSQTNPAQWRANLEAVFNVDRFLRWLAVSNSIVNWDSYGTLPHNYYLYNDPALKLSWIPWDHNLAFTGSPGVTSAPGRQGLSMMMNEITPAWPLIFFIIRDPVYNQKYRDFVQVFSAGAFSEAATLAKIDQYAAMISPYVIGAAGEQTNYTYLSSQSAFTAAIPALKAHISARKLIISQFLQ